MKKIVILLVSIVSLNLCAKDMVLKSDDGEAIKAKFIKENISKIRSELTLFSAGVLNDTDELKVYLDFYKLDKPELKTIGFIESTNYKIGVFSFNVTDPIGTFYLSHGFYDNTGYMSSFINLLIEARYNVIAFDLPGHGLSTGEQADVNSFFDYADVAQDVLNRTKDLIVGKAYYLGFSTGAIAPLTHLALEKDFGIEKYFLVSPLIDVRKMKILNFVNWLAGKMIKSVPRPRNNSSSSDKDFLKFKNMDSLQSSFTTTHWYQAYQIWNRWFKSCNFKDNNSPIVHIQGTNDNTVAGDLNAQYLNDRFKNIKTYMIKGGRHHLLNDAPDIKKEVHNLILKHL